MDPMQINDMQMIVDKNIFKKSDEIKIIDQLEPCEIFPRNYTIELPSLCQDSFGQALTNSLFNLTNPQPLVLYIYDARSVNTDVFNALVLHSESINICLAEQFSVWKWDRTEENYHELLTTVLVHAGEEVAAVIDSSPNEVYPLLICLIFDRGQIKVEGVIQNMFSENEALAVLIQARDVFNARFELPDTSGLNLRSISTENWSIPASTLTEVPKESAEFRRVAADFNGGASSIVRIDRIENTIWLVQYLNQKDIIDARLGHADTEKLLFHGCPYGAAEQILQEAFDHNRIGRNGTYYGHGFYFSSRRLESDRFAVANQTTGEKRILMCRVLVGRSCRGDSSMRTCPVNYDSTSNGSNIHVVYSNRHVLPEYLITYK
ncbi:unnamed protein product [Rotaria magnacalcarata]|uniref:Poly [ADP-ribose] polymerase n=1 Tax=Rotaria magnacalcarata TaxID=392030 RepID=A0A816X8M4_9BILA|nr:unnamed protein product [Rotaria magnacalcarata]CAF1520626.1 unnamed protein product [Rotaria magnacalcarata]CAF2143951.1 unnamed protein product [Rotaria magnacalcarata]CAF3982486.1 unnamed protein product [Rotaria magnacalcarata]CAF4001983.1 unnamed protein product [Rotaria magnacalcarata]